MFADPSPPLRTLTAATLLDAAALVAGLQAGEAPAVAQLVQQYSPLLYRYAYYQLQDAMLAEDVVAEVWLRVIEKVAGYRHGPTPFKAWLFRIAANLITDHHRRCRRRPQVSLEHWLTVAPGAEPGRNDGAIDGLPVRTELLASLGTLTAEQRTVILLHMEGWELPQVAQLLGRSLPSVKGLYYRGIDSLRRALAAPTPPAAPAPTHRPGGSARSWVGIPA